MKRSLLSVAFLLSAATLVFLLFTETMSSAQPDSPRGRGPIVNSRLKVRLPDGAAPVGEGTRVSGRAGVHQLQSG